MKFRFQSGSAPVLAFCLASLLMSACGGAGQGGADGLINGVPGYGVPASGTTRRLASASAPALIYNGTGTAQVDAASIESILADHGMPYRTADSAEINSMTLEELQSHSVIIWPGGLATQMSNSIASAARDRIRLAVQVGGTSYVGFCAGTFIFGRYPAKGDWGIQAVPFDFEYYYLEHQGVEADMVQVKLADGSQRDLVWYGGPQMGEFGQPVGYYPNGEVAISQAYVGHGFTLLSGPHPESPDSWRRDFNLNDSDGSDAELAWQMIHAAIQRKPMAGF